MQWGLEVGFEKARVTLAFMPLMLAVLAAAALSWKIAPGWISRSAPWLALAGIAFAGCSAAMRAHQRRALDREIEVLKTQSTANDRSLRGLDRAAWLLGREFSYQEDWEIDVSLLHEGDGALRKAVDDWVATLENQVRRETTGN
jgi:hypothetical protein